MTNIRGLVAVWTIGLAALAALPGAAGADDGAKRASGGGAIVNEAADAMFGCLVPPFSVDGTHGKAELTEAFEKLADRYADAGIRYLFLNVCYQRTAYPSKVWDSYWDLDDPDTDTTSWPRLSWLVHKKGVDAYAVCAARCRRRGVSPWMSIRMNDTHYIDDPSKTSTLWQKHPELRRQAQSGFDFANKRVRDYNLALIKELMERYDCDGVELDWMRFPWHFKPGEEQQGREHLNDFMREARKLANAATVRWGHPVGIAVRIPAVPEFARGLGMDGVVWVKEGLVDILILASVWRPSDTDIPVERWRELIGPVEHKYLLAAGTDLWIQSSSGGKLMKDDLQTQCGFTAAMIDRGADLVYLFNHFNMGDFRQTRTMPDGRTVVRDENHAILNAAGRMAVAIDKPRRHVVSFHDPVSPGADYKRPLPADVGPDKPATFRIYTGPKPRSGRVVIRAGLAERPGFKQARLGARLLTMQKPINGVECKLIEDLTAPKSLPLKVNPHDQRVVPHVAYVAPRVVQFEAPREALKRGYNTVEISLRQGSPQRLIWVEVYIAP